jgi:hypothetical protein
MEILDYLLGFESVPIFLFLCAATDLKIAFGAVVSVVLQDLIL